MQLHNVQVVVVVQRFDQSGSRKGLVYQTLKSNGSIVDGGIRAVSDIRRPTMPKLGIEGRPLGAGLLRPETFLVTRARIAVGKNREFWIGIDEGDGLSLSFANSHRVA